MPDDTLKAAEDAALRAAALDTLDAMQSEGWRRWVAYDGPKGVSIVFSRTIDGGKHLERSAVGATFAEAVAFASERARAALAGQLEETENG